MEYWLWLSMLNTKINNLTLLNLLKTYKTPDKIFYLTNKELCQNKIEKQEIDFILNIKYRQNLAKYLDYMKKQQIEIIPINNALYPQKLRCIYNPPVAIYVKGNKQILQNKSIAIIGCRNCSKYGIEIAQKIAYQLSKQNINIISGLARGIDANAHIGTLKQQGKAIAVLGSGLDIIYPMQNEELANCILQHDGTLVSEYVVGEKPTPDKFPRRNRIISGLSDGVIVVEAREKSGTFITVDFALEQGKEIYVVPGNINSVTSEGTNKLLKEGAKPITSAQDVLEDILFPKGGEDGEKTWKRACKKE